MNLYSFAVRKKGEEKYVPLKEKHELAFLDYMVGMFNHQKELMYFLGIDSEKYDSVQIMERDTKTILPIISATDLARIADYMLNFPMEYDFAGIAEDYYDGYSVYFHDLEQIKFIIYDLESWLGISDQDEKIKEIIAQMRALLRKVKRKYKRLSTYEPSEEFWDDEMEVIKEEDEEKYNSYAKEFIDLYKEIRDLYVKLREDCYLMGQTKIRTVPHETGRKMLKDVKAKRKYNAMYRGLSRNIIALQEQYTLREMFINMMAGSEEAFKAWEALDDKTKEEYAPMLEYVGFVRGKAKKLGTRVDK